MLRKGMLTGKLLTAHNPGGTLSIRLEQQGEAITAIYLEGPTEIVKVYEL